MSPPARVSNGRSAANAVPGVRRLVLATNQAGSTVGWALGVACLTALVTQADETLGAGALEVAELPAFRPYFPGALWR